jgi:glc operon protein GlcG
MLTLEIARKVVAAAEAEAARNHLVGVVAVVDDGGWPILIERMDQAAYLAAAYLASVELAPGKARTAALFKKPIQALEAAINHGRVAAVMQGGLPIVADGEVIGAIGASFDTPEHVVKIAEAGLAAVPH